MSNKERARLKLAGTYLAIIMAMSIVFSVVLYSASSNQLDRSLRRLQTAEPRSTLEQAFDEIRRSRLDESRVELQKKVLFFNLTTLLFGAALSYILAREALRPIEETLEAQERFASDASHELRTPLTAMRSEIEVALRENKLSAADARGVLQSNLEEVTKLEALTSGLLQLARQENTEEALDIVSLKDIVEHATESIVRKAEDKKISIDTSSMRDVKVKGSASSLEQVAVILLDNAIKYSPGGSTVTASSFSGRGGHGFVVKDNGVGIAKADLPYIFERFYRSDESRTNSANEGYGLGLSIAKQIIELHGGSIDINSRQGKGTTVKVSLQKA